MIKPNEIRIGNLVNWEAEHLGGGVSKVISVGEHYFEAESLQGLYIREIENSNNIEPIPLTPEWLESIGMKKRFSSDDCNIWDIKEELKPLPTRNKTFTLALIDKGWVYPTAPGAVPFHYVHQLQNLYFALTGEELAIKGNA